MALDEDSQYDDVDEGGDNNAEDETSPAVHVQRQLQLDEQEEEAVEEEEDAVEDSESEVQAVETKQEAPVAMATPTAAVEEVEQRATTEATPIATVTSVASPTQPAAASPAAAPGFLFRIQMLCFVTFRCFGRTRHRARQKSNMGFL